MEYPVGWVCDRCGEPVADAKDGFVQWVVLPGTGLARDLRLFHTDQASPQGTCQYDDKTENVKDRGTVSSFPLSGLEGPDGLMMLLSILQKGAIPAEAVVEMIKRIHVPGYEHARGRLQAAIEAGVLEPSYPEGFPRQREIEAVVAWEQKIE